MTLDHNMGHSITIFPQYIFIFLGRTSRKLYWLINLLGGIIGLILFSPVFVILYLSLLIITAILFRSMSGLFGFYMNLIPTLSKEERVDEYNDYIKNLHFPTQEVLSLMTRKHMLPKILLNKLVNKISDIELFLRKSTFSEIETVSEEEAILTRESLKTFESDWEDESMSIYDKVF